MSFYSFERFSWIPVRGPTGTVEGIFNPSFEYVVHNSFSRPQTLRNSVFFLADALSRTTSRVVAERRLGTLRDLVQITLVSRNQQSYKDGCLESISKNPYDLPFAIVSIFKSNK